MKNVFLSIVLLCICTQVSAKGGDPAKGEKLATEGYCYTCHGDRGIAPSRNAPSLAGQGEKYFVSTLKKYKAKKLFVDNKSLGMQGIVQPMSKQDMKDLAAFYAKQKLPMHIDSAAMPETVEDNCSDCHTDDGTWGMKGKAPGLGGMSAAYILRQLKAYKAGDRKHKKMDMEDIGKLSDAQLAEIANYYSNKTQ